MSSSCTTPLLLASALMAVAAMVNAGEFRAHILSSRTAGTTQESEQTSASSPTLTGPRVQTSSGQLVGLHQSLHSNATIYKFLSVPYAEAPIGKLRFQRPVELKTTNQEAQIDASKFGKTCPQFRHLTRFISPLLNIDQEHQTSEDCLQLNVFVPASVGSTSDNKLVPSRQLPVIVWIPGEGFDFADARQFDGSHLAHKTQSIVVTVQYRVGILGFLHAPKLGITGNMGIYDQLMALKWIQRNIWAFGGDSDRVTLMGRFSGSMSISAIITAQNQDLLQAHGKPLFTRVAMLSGIAVDNWIIDSNQFERVDSIEKAAVEKGLCSQAQTDCLISLPSEQLLPIAGYGWRLVVDNELIGQKAPIEAIKANQFAPQLEGVLIGETGMEGTLCLYRHLLSTHSNNFAQLIEEDKLTTGDLYDILKDDSHTYFGYNLTERNPIQATLETLIEANNAQQQLTKDSSDVTNGGSSKLREKYLDACSAYMVKSHLNRFKRNILARNQFEENRMDSNKKSVEVFHYQLKYKPTFSLAPDYIKVAAHGDDIPLIFGLVYNQPRDEINESDLLISRKLMSYVGNFVHGNNPLLRQHATIETSAGKSQESEAISSMDESEQIDAEAPTFAGSFIRRNWSSDSQVFPIEMNERDFRELNLQRRVQEVKATGDTKQPRQSSGSSNIRVYVVARPTWTGQPDQDLEAQQHHQRLSLIDIVESKSQVADEHSIQSQLRRQSGGNFWYQTHEARRQSGQLTDSTGAAAHHSTMALVTDSSFMTILLFSSCMIVFAVMSFCLGLCLMVMRCNLSNLGAKDSNDSQKHQAFGSSPSSCNICDDSQDGSLDAVLTSTTRKQDSKGFGNVFAKLRRPSFTQSCRQANGSTNINSNPSPAAATSTLMAPQKQQQQHSAQMTSNHNHRPQNQHQAADSLAALHSRSIESQG